jgi:hypothetical protein
MLDGFKGPAFDDEPLQDAWGWFMSGYSPIVDEDGTVLGDQIRTPIKIWVRMNSARIGLRRSFVVTQAHVIVVAVDEVGAPKIMGALNFPTLGIGQDCLA